MADFNPRPHASRLYMAGLIDKKRVREYETYPLTRFCSFLTAIYKADSIGQPRESAIYTYIAELEVEALHPRGDFTGRGVGREPLSFLPITGADHGRQVRTAAAQR